MRIEGPSSIDDLSYLIINEYEPFKEFECGLPISPELLKTSDKVCLEGLE